MRTSLLPLVLLAGCVQGTDVGSEFNQLTTISQRDGGAVGTRDECPAREWDAGPGACEGPLAIVDTSQWEAFQSLGCETFCGDLTIVQNGDTFLGPGTVLPAALTDTTLKTVTGKLHIWGAFSVTSINFQELRTANAIDISHNELLESVSLPNLSSTGRYDMVRNPELTELHAPQATYFGNVWIWQNPRVTLLDLPALSSVPERLWISDNASLRQCVADGIIAGLYAPPSRSEAVDNFGVPNVCN